MHSQFKLILNLTKGYQADDGRLFVEGIASGTDLDLTGERMSPDAIQSMAKSLQQGIVEFRSEHSSDWDSMFGEVVELSVTDDHQLHYKAELDPGFSKSHDLLHALARGKKLGVSIGGQVVKAGMEWVEELQRSVYTYFDIALKEISVTAQPAYAQAWVSTISKSIDRNSALMPDITKNDDAPVADAAPVVAQPAAPTVTGAPAEDEAPAPANAPSPEPAAAPAATPEVVAEAPAAPEAPAEPAAPAGDAPASAVESPENAPAPEAESPEAAAPAPASDPMSATDPASADNPLGETQKAQYLSEWAEADATCAAIESLTDYLPWQIASLVADDDLDAAAQKAAVDALLTEFHAIALRIASALIDQDAASDAAEMAKTRPTREVLTKSLTERSSALDAVRKALAETTKQLEDTQATLAAAEAQAARKAHVFEKYQGQLADPDSSLEAVATTAATKAAEATLRPVLQEQTEAARRQAWARFITGGK